MRPRLTACVRACVRPCVRASVRVSIVLVCSYFIPSFSLFVFSVATFNTVSLSFCVYCLCV